MEEGFSTQVILAKSPAIVEDGFSPDVGIVIDLLQTKESIQASMVPVALKEQAGFYIYRFQVPVGCVYRFRLSSRLSPLTKRQPSATQLIDYAISRAAAEDGGGICPNHFRPLANGNELHLGEADYLALLVRGQCACSTIVTASCCYKRPFVGGRGRELGDATANARPGAAITLDGRGGEMILGEQLALNSEQKGWTYGELTQNTLDDQLACFPEPDHPATALDAVPTVDSSWGKRAVDGKEGSQAKWNGVFASGEDGDCHQRCLHKQGTSVQMKPGDEEMDDDDEEEEELEREPMLSVTTRAHDASWSKDSTELFRRRFRLGSGSSAGPGSGHASAGDEPSSTRPLHPDVAVLSASGDEPWPSAAAAEEANDDARQTYVFERCQRNCVQASEKDNILFVVFDDHRAFFLSQLNENFRQSLCSATLPLPSDVVRDLLQVLSGSKFFRLLDESESEPRHPIVGSDFEPLLLSTFKSRDPVVDTDAEIAIQPHEPKDSKRSVRSGLRQTLSSEDLEAASGSASVSAPLAADVETDAAAAGGGAIIEIEDVTIECGSIESYNVDFQLRLRLWRRARLAVVRAFHRIRDFFRGLFLGLGHSRQPSCERRRGRLSQPSSTGGAERVECSDLSKQY